MLEICKKTLEKLFVSFLLDGSAGSGPKKLFYKKKVQKSFL